MGAGGPRAPRPRPCSTEPMAKWIYALWKRGGSSVEALAAELRGPFLDEVRPSVRGLTLNLADGAVAAAQARSRITRMTPPLDAVLAVFGDDDATPRSVEASLAPRVERLWGYRVRERVVLPNTTRGAAPGDRTPGVNLVSFLRRPPRMTPEAWLRHWSEVHESVALETQCTFGYVRNVVEESLGEAEPFAGIVEELFPEEAMTDRRLWYRAAGDEATYRKNFGRMMESVRGFLDPEQVESHPMSEIRLV